MFNGQSIYDAGFITIKGINGNPVNGMRYSPTFFNQNPYMTQYNMSAYSTPYAQTGYGSTPTYVNINARVRTRTKSRNAFAAALPFLVFSGVFLDLMFMFMNKAEDALSNAKPLEDQTVAVIKFSIESGDEYKNAYGFYLNGDDYTLYYLYTTEANIEYGNYEDGDVNVSATSNLDSLQGYSGLKEGTVKVSEIYTVSIVGEEKLSFEVAAARLRGNSQNLTYVFGGIGGVMAALWWRA